MKRAGRQLAKCTLDTGGAREVGWGTRVAVSQQTLIYFCLKKKMLII